jgi:hypothetical protein
MSVAAFPFAGAGDRSGSQEDIGEREMKPVEDRAAVVAETQTPRRAWAPPSARRIATSEAENSTGIGPDAETVAS